jgi:hypothetical protein
MAFMLDSFKPGRVVPVRLPQAGETFIGAELSDTRAWVERTECAIPQAGVAAKPCRSNGGMDGASRRTDPVRSTPPRWSARSADHPPDRRRHGAISPPDAGDERADIEAPLGHASVVTVPIDTDVGQKRMERVAGRL